MSQHTSDEPRPRTYTGAEFLGRWVGETQGHDSPAHQWEISQHGRSLRIDTAWEGQATAGPMFATIVSERPAFRIGHFTAVLLDPQHFILPAWDTNDTRDNIGPDYDVIFSRPGIAELSAGRVYERWKAEQEPAPRTENRERGTLRVNRAKQRTKPN